MEHEFKRLSVGDKVYFKPDKEWYTVESIEIDVVYMTDRDGNPITATKDDIDY